MYQKYIDKLEFNKILDILSEYCTTTIGKNLAKTLHPETKKEIVSYSLKETDEAISLIYKKRKSILFTNFRYNSYSKNFRKQRYFKC